LKPRLLIILNRLSIGGPASNTLALASLLSNDFEVLLIAGKPLKDEQSAEYLLEQYTGFKVEILSSFKRAVLPLDDLKAYFKIRKTIKEFRPHIVHTHGSKPGVLGRIAAHQLKTKLVFHTFHGHVFHSYFNPFVSKLIVRLERWLATYTTTLIAINEQIRKDLLETYRICNQTKVELNRLGIECENLQDVDGTLRKKFRSEFHIEEEVLAIGIIGRLVPVKNHFAFIDLAASLLARNQTGRTLKFFIIGDGDEKMKLIQHISQKGISWSDNESELKQASDIIFTSWRTDIPAVMAGLDLVVLTSLNEGTPVSILEAMAAGRPVVASNVGGIRELFQQSDTGFVVNTEDEMLNKVEMLLNSDRLRKEIGVNSQNYTKNYLSIRHQAEALKQLYINKLKNG
jgi:glycosyltransferase involved in cell wall biosynthesis